MDGIESSAKVGGRVDVSDGIDLLSIRAAVSSEWSESLLTMARLFPPPSPSMGSTLLLTLLARKLLPAKAEAIVTTDWTGADGFLSFLALLPGLLEEEHSPSITAAEGHEGLGAFWTSITRLYARHLRHNVRYMVHWTYMKTIPPREGDEVS